ncbi:unnamed protein product [Gemmata massiliana]|uniref:Uncharacterized protein n=1 Tax=Gemmata massiliana TaxID=1210884 RepID=A0A6P2D9B2_9BACT|nr:hypothetical protein [Gemmata massiliana]VTR96080.1 unnamed protein product [Gemmata massiliana]
MTEFKKLSLQFHAAIATGIASGINMLLLLAESPSPEAQNQFLENIARWQDVLQKLTENVPPVTEPPE